MFYNWLNNSPKDLAEVLENKGIKKIGFWGQKGSTDRDYGQLAQLAEEPINRLYSSGRGSIEDAPKPSLSPSGILFPVEVIFLPVEDLLRQR